MYVLNKLDNRLPLFPPLYTYFIYVSFRYYIFTYSFYFLSKVTKTTILDYSYLYVYSYLCYLFLTVEFQPTLLI